MLKLANLLIQFRKKVQVVRQKRLEERNGPKGIKQHLEQKKKLFCLLNSLDILDLYKETGPGIEKVKLTGHPLILK